MTSLAAHDLVLRYGSGRSAGPDIVRGITFEVPENAVTVLIGANGCGKSTLFAGLARLLKPAAGDVLLDGRSIDATPTREVAKALALLPQHPIAPEGMTVAELVRQGRTPHQGLLGRGGPDDDAAVAAAMEATVSATTEPTKASVMDTFSAPKK